MKFFVCLFLCGFERHGKLCHLTNIRQINAKRGVAGGDIFLVGLCCIHDKDQDALACNQLVIIRVIEEVGINLDRLPEHTSLF